MAAIVGTVVLALDLSGQFRWRPPSKYAQRWDHADGTSSSAAIVFHYDGSFAFVRNSWETKRRSATGVWRSPPAR